MATEELGGSGILSADWELRCARQVHTAGARWLGQRDGLCVLTGRLRCEWQVLTEELGGLVSSLSFGRSMRWNSEASFSRPVRFLLALHGSAALPFSFAGLQAGAAAPAYLPPSRVTVMSHTTGDRSA